jgi:hypothetical protein
MNENMDLLSQSELEGDPRDEITRAGRYLKFQYRLQYLEIDELWDYLKRFESHMLREKGAEIDVVRVAECYIIDKTPDDELPLLMGQLYSKAALTMLEKRLKGERK